MANRKVQKTYLEFEVNAENGVKQSFWIQDATEKYFEQIIDNYVNGFLNDEPISKYMNATADEVSMQETRVFLKEVLEENLTLICLAKNQSGIIQLAGFNILSLVAVGEQIEFPFQGWFTNFIFNFYKFLDSQKDAFKEFDCEKCLKAFGLFVLPQFRGRSIGARILEARSSIGKDRGVKLTTTMFTSFISQKQAYSAGFKDYIAFDYLDLGVSHPEFRIPNIEEHTKTVKIMYKVME